MKSTRRQPPLPELDAVDRRLLGLLARDGRRPAADLAKELKLSRQAVALRLRALERRKVIRGYRAEVDPAALGLGIRAQIRLALDGTADRRRETELVRRLAQSPLVQSLYRVSGEDCFVAEVLCRTIDDVSALLDGLRATRALQSSRTAFVLEVLADRGAAGPVEAAGAGEA